MENEISEIVKYLCDESINWYNINLNDECPEDLAMLDEWLKTKTNININIINKFRELYQKWMFYAMNCIEHNVEHVNNHTWIFANWYTNFDKL